MMFSAITADLVAQVQRPDRSLLYHRDDPNDIRLGTWVETEPKAYGAAEVVVLGCPQDEGVRRNGGRPGAAHAPADIRRALYRLGIAGLEHLRVFDLGDTLVQPTLEATHTLQQRIVQQVLADGKRLIVLGGGNDLSYPDCAGLAHVAGPVLAFNIDAHFDVRADTPRNSGTPYRQLLDERVLAPDHFYEIGAQPFSNSSTYAQYLDGQGVRIVWAEQLRTGDLRGIMRAVIDRYLDAPIFWGFDMDVVCAADAPGVSTPNPLGISGADLCLLADLAGSLPGTRVVEFTEVNPLYDVDGRTCQLAAVALWHVLAAFARMEKQR
jgi:formiminoglutamase